jgi:predicted O-methyltransferase YrrM
VEFSEFYGHFGGSLRTKHLQLGLGQRARRTLATKGNREYLTARAGQVAKSVRKDPAAALGRFGARRSHAAKQTVAPKVASLASHERVDSHVLLRQSAKRPYSLPAPNGLPTEFIRLDPWEAEYMFLLASRAKLGIVETGRFYGGSTFLMACANEDVPIHSVDIAPQDDDRLRHFLAKYGVGGNVNLIVGDSQNVKYPEVGDVDMLFVDGDHSYDGCKADLENWFDSVVTGGHVVLHDSYFGVPVQDAVIDFINERGNDVEIVRPPWINATHWHNPTGSLAHFVKRA